MFNRPSVPRSVLLGLLAAAVLACGTEPEAPTCDGGLAANAAACVDKAAYVDDLTFIAKARPNGSAHHLAVREMLVKRLKDLKFKVTAQNYGSGVNVVGELTGTSKPDEVVVVGAHYDSVPDCAGADDNGTGVAGALQVAAALARYSHERTLQVVFWDEEERGLVGARAHARQLVAATRKVVTVFDFEMIGYSSKDANSQELPAGFDVIFKEAGKYWWDNDKRGDFIAVIYDAEGKQAADAFISAATKEGLAALPVELSAEYRSSSTFSALRRSDHAEYWSEGYPGMMITDTANYRNKGYHCLELQDSLDRLDHDFALGVVKATTTAAVSTLKAGAGPAVSAATFACSLDKQDCPAGERCSPYAAEGRRWMPTCKKLAATTVGLHASCERVKNKLGDDNCAKGLFCSPWGVPRLKSANRQCVSVCTSDSTCAKSEVCVSLGQQYYNASVMPATVGLCVKRCDPFAKDGCGKDLTCQSGFMSNTTLQSLHTCMALGEVEEGAACRAYRWGDCSAGLDCTFGPKGEKSTCRRPCDASHPCAKGSCVPDGALALTGVGHCFP